MSVSMGGMKQNTGVPYEAIGICLGFGMSVVYLGVVAKGKIIPLGGLLNPNEIGGKLDAYQI